MKDATKTEIKLQADRTLCSSCGTCLSVAPHIFEFDDDFISRVKKNPGKIDLKTAKEAVDSCPSGAIKIIK